MTPEKESPSREEIIAHIDGLIDRACPKIGIDDEATQWWRTKVYEPNRAHAEQGGGADGFREYWMRSYEEILAKNHGKWVPELARDRGGVAMASGILASCLDFRGKKLGFFYEIIGNDLCNEASSDHTAQECLDYARRLEIAVGDSTAPHIEILAAAIAWLRFWGERGFGFSASS